MKRLSTYLNERLIINKNYKQPNYKHVHKLTPQTFKELRQIIEDRYNKLGPGTKQKPIDFNDIDVSKIDSFYEVSTDTGIFQETGFEYIDISYWNVSNVENMSNMFEKCHELKSVGNLSNWNVLNVKEMRWTFYECNNLKSVGDISNWNVSKVKIMMGMFENCGIKNIPDWY